MSKKRIIRKSVAGVLALTMMAPSVLPSGEFVMDVLDSGILKVSAEDNQEESNICNNGCPVVDVDLYYAAFGELVPLKVDLKTAAKSVDLLISSSKDGEYTCIEENIDVSEAGLSLSLPVCVQQETWYKFEITFADDSVESTEPVIFYPYNYLYNGGYNDYNRRLYLSNGNMAYNITKVDEGDPIQLTMLDDFSWEAMSAAGYADDDTYLEAYVAIYDEEKEEYTFDDNVVMYCRNDVGDDTGYTCFFNEDLPENCLFKLTFDQEHYSEPIHNVYSGEAIDFTIPYSDTDSVTVSGYLPYHVWEYYFDIVGQSEGKWFGTSYNEYWEIETGSDESPDSIFYEDIDRQRLKALKFYFDKNNPNTVKGEAYLADTENSFGFGCDVMISDNDNAPVTVVKNKKNEIIQAQLVDTYGALEDITSDMNSLVINTKELPPDYGWVGFYDYRTYNSDNFYDFSDEYSMYYSYDEQNRVYQMQGFQKDDEADSGITLSWTNLPVGSMVPFSFNMGPVEKTGALKSALYDDGQAISSTEFNIVNASNENWYRIQKKDGENFTDIKLKYDETTGKYYPSDEGELWFQPLQDGMVTVTNMEAEANYVVSIIPNDEKLLMDSGDQSVEPVTKNVYTFIDPLIPEDKEKPVSITATGSTIKIENLREGFKYALDDITSYIAPVNGTVEFTNLLGGTTYELVAASDDNKDIKSERVEITTKYEVRFIDAENNFSKAYVLDVGEKLSETDFEEMMNYAPENNGELRSFEGWVNYEKEDFLKENLELEDNENYYAFGAYKLSKFNNQAESNVGVCVDLRVSDIINDVEKTRPVIVFNGVNEDIYDLAPGESMSGKMDYSYSLVYLGQKDGTDYFAVGYRKSDLEGLVLEKDDPLFTDTDHFSPAFIEYINKGKTGIFIDGDSDINNMTFYGIGEVMVPFVFDDESDISYGESVCKEINDWIFADENGVIKIHGDNSPFDYLLSYCSYEYMNNGKFVRESKCVGSYDGSWLYSFRIDDIYNGSEMVLGDICYFEIYDEYGDNETYYEVNAAEPFPEELFEYLNKKYSDRDNFIGWFSYSQGGLLDPDNKDCRYSYYEDEGYNDKLKPVFGIAASKCEEYTVGTTVANSPDVSFLNDTDQKCCIWVDGECTEIDPESLAEEYFQYMDFVEGKLYFLGSEDIEGVKNYYFATEYLYASDFVDSFFAIDDKEKYLDIDKLDSYFPVWVEGIVGVEDGVIPWLPVYDDVFKNKCYHMKNSKWRYIRTCLGSGIIDGEYPFDGISSLYKTGIINNAGSSVIRISEDNGFLDFDGISTPINFIRVIESGINLSQINGIEDIYIDGEDDYFHSDDYDGCIPFGNSKIEIYSTEKIDFDPALRATETFDKNEKIYQYNIDCTKLDDDVLSKLYIATHKHVYGYYTDNKNSDDINSKATLVCRCLNEEDMDYIELAKLQIDDTVYYGVKPVPEVILMPENLCNGETLKAGMVTYSTGDAVASEVPTKYGVYNISAQIIMTDKTGGVTRYSLSKDVSYEKRPLDKCEVTVSPLTYNGESQRPEVTVINPATGEEVSSDDYTISFTQQTNAGEYEFTLTAKNSSLNYCGSYSGTWTIEKADLTNFRINSQESYTYGNEYFIGVSGCPTGDEDKVTYKYYSYSTGEEIDKPKDAGKYIVKAFYKDGTNYNDAETEDFVYKINKKEVTVLPPKNMSITYGDTNPLKFECDLEGMTFEDLKGVLPEQIESEDDYAEYCSSLVKASGFSLDGVQEGTSNNAGKYQLVLSADAIYANLKNYTFVLDSSPVYLTVEPKQITSSMFKLYGNDGFDSEKTSYEYDGTKKEVSFGIDPTYSPDGYEVFSSEDFEQGGRTNAVKAGTYMVEFAGNYELYGTGNWTGFVTLDWSISPEDMDIEVHMTDAEETGGNSKEYDGTAAEFEVVSRNDEVSLPSDAVIEYTYYIDDDDFNPDELDESEALSSAPTDAGDYAVVVSVTAPNINIPDYVFEYTIDRKEVNVIVDEETTTAVYRDEIPAITYTLEGICDVDAEDYEGNTTGGVMISFGEEAVSAKTYELVCTLTDPNYDFKLSKDTFEVTPREILEEDVTLKNYRVFIPDEGWAVPTLTVTSMGDLLEAKKDYIFSGDDRTRLKGEKTFNVVGTGNYKGEVEVTWEAVKEDDLSVLMTKAEPVYAGGNYKVKYNFEMPEIPEGLEVVQYGAIYSKTGALAAGTKLTDTSNYTIRTTGYNGSYGLILNAGDEMSAETSAIGYVILADKAGNNYERYSNVSTYSYAEASSSAEDYGQITAQPVTAVKEDGKYKVVYKFDIETPDGFKVTEYGALYDKSGTIGDDLTYETAANNKTSNKADGKITSYTLKMNKTGALEDTTSARCYAKITDGTNEYIIYSDVVSNSFMKIARAEVESNCSIEPADPGYAVASYDPSRAKPFREEFVFNITAGEGYSIKTRGALYNKEGLLNMGTTLDDKDVLRTTNTGGAGTYTLAMNDAERTKVENGSVIGYIIVEDKYGLKHEIYTHVIRSGAFDN